MSRLLRSLGAAAFAVMAPLAARAADPDALWKIVHGRCVPDQQANDRPAPCASVDVAHGEAGGFAVLKDIKGASQYLLIPTAKITGIEDPQILLPGATDYFAPAWDATALVDARLHRTLPRQDLSLAINSESGRSQDQLHIHVDCIDPDVRAALDRAAPTIGDRWSWLPMRLSLHRYRAIRLPADALGRTSPFQVLARSLPDPAREMGRHTLVLVGDRQGFVLLDGEASMLSTTPLPSIKLGPGSGEELQDHACRIAS